MNKTLFAVGLLLVAMPLSSLLAQQSGPVPQQSNRRTYVEQNGTHTITETLESEYHVNGDEEVEIQRYRAPAYSGDTKIQWEREIRTRKLSDGTVEKQTILRSPDGGGTLVPVQLINQRVVSNADSTVAEREMLQQRGREDFQVVEKEKIVETRSGDTTHIVRELKQPNIEEEWKTVRRETSSSSISTVDGNKERTFESVVQVPDASAGLGDYEKRQEHAVTRDKEQLREMIVFRRDDTTTDPGHFFLLDHSREEVSNDGSGSTDTHLIRKSLLLPGNLMSNPYSPHDPEVVEERQTVEKKGPDGSTQTVTAVRGRTAGDPTTIRPVYTIMRMVDSLGYVRQVYIPNQ